MSGEISIIITMVAIGVALASFMLVMFRWQDKRIDQRFDDVNRRFEILEADVKEVVKEVAEVKGSLRTLHHGLRISVGEPADPD